MSVRLIKITTIIAVLHVIFLSVLWIGFPVPLPKPHVDFVYMGGSVDRSVGGEINDQVRLSAGKFDFDHFDAPTFAPWVNLRAVNKPKR